MNKRYALCVGNNYPGTNAELYGCVNDATDWSELLLSQGYDVTMRLEATLNDTISCLMDMVEKAGFGDRIVFTYSGHGTWLPDRDGDEADGRDEALVMSDYLRGGLMLDDTIQNIFSKVKRGVGTLLISDSCHSGTVSRFAALSPDRRKPRFMSPVGLIAGMTDERAVALEQAPANTSRPTASLISGCGDMEYSYDATFNGRSNGALTRTAIDAFTPGISLNAWFKKIRATLPNDFYPQTPELTSTPYRKYTKAL